MSTKDCLSEDNPCFTKLFKSSTADNVYELESLTKDLKNLSSVNITHPVLFMERKTNENHNDKLRRFHLKGISLKDYSIEQNNQITH